MTLPSFLMPLSPIPVPSVPPIGGAPSGLSFTMEAQQQSNWCWAATTASVSKFFMATSTWSQCNVAGSCLSLNCCGNPGPCNQPYYLDLALTTTGNYAGPVTGSYSFANIQTEINGGKPVCCHISWNGGGGHFVAIYGYDQVTNDVEIGDPYSGNSTIPYSGLLSGYQGSGTWDYTYLTS